MWNVFLKTITCQKQNKKDKVPQPTQLQFLMSSLNIELVHIILKAVSQYTVGTPKSKDFTKYQDYDFTSSNRFTIDSIEIENRKNWEQEVSYQEKDHSGTK